MTDKIKEKLLKEIEGEEKTFNGLTKDQQKRVRKEFERVTMGERLFIIEIAKAKLQQHEETRKDYEIMFERYKEANKKDKKLIGELLEKLDSPKFAKEKK